LLPALIHDPTFRWGELLEQAIDHKLLCLLADTVELADLTEIVPGRLLRFLRHNQRCNQYKIAIYRAEATRIESAAQAAGVTLAAVKGIAVESSLYGGRGGRQFSDIDLLVCEEDLPACADLLAKLGYRPGHADLSSRTVVPPSAHGTGTPTTYSRVLDDVIVPSIAVDLTVRFSEHGPGHDVPIRDVLDRCELQEVSGHPGVALQVLSSSDHLLFVLLALRQERTGRGRHPSMRLCADALRLVAACPPEMNVEFARKVAALGLEQPVAEALAWLQQIFPHAQFNPNVRPLVPDEPIADTKGGPA
jgi:hypothetical protein